MEPTYILTFCLGLLWYFGYLAKMETAHALKASAELIIQKTENPSGKYTVPEQIMLVNIAGLDLNSWSFRLVVFVTWPFTIQTHAIESLKGAKQ